MSTRPIAGSLLVVGPRTLEFISSRPVDRQSTLDAPHRAASGQRFRARCRSGQSDVWQPNRGQSNRASVFAVGSATGLGDTTVNARYMVVGTGLRGASVGADIRFPTGRPEDLLGAGEATGRFLGIGTWEEGHLGVNLNGGVGIGGLSREVFWGAATTLAPTPRVTIVGEVMGRWLSELSRVSDVYQPHPLLPGVETMRWLSLDPGIHTMFLVTGAKWNVGGTGLLNINLLIRVTDAGVTARVTPAVSLDYAFQR